MASHQWLERWCHVCGAANHGKCPQHCTCPKTKPEPVTIDNWQNTAKIAEDWQQHTAKFGETVSKEWFPYRDAREPGEEG